jgi:hypothetical protein
LDRNSSGILVLVVVVASAALACGAPPNASYDPGYAYNAPPPDDGYRPEPPLYEHEDVIALQEAGMHVYLGNEPPSITGAYMTDSTEIYYDDLDHERDIADDYVFEFHNQDDVGGVRVSYSSQIASDVMTGLYGALYGENDCFTVFVMNVQGIYEDCSYHTIFLYSGCIGDTGIEGWQNGVVMSEKQGETCDDLMDVGHRRIIHEADELASGVVPAA